jgi:PAS domain S-box-containing protein
MVFAGGVGVAAAIVSGNDTILMASLFTALGGLMFAVLLRQMETRRALRESEARFRALSALGSDWYWEADSEYRLTHISDGLGRLSGRAISDFLGQPRWHHAFVTPVGADWSAHKTVISRRAPFRDLQLCYVSPQGVVAYGSVSGEPVFRDDGTLAGYRGVGNDVTAEVVLRQRLRMQHDVTRILSQATDNQFAIKAVIETICRTMEWSWGAQRSIDPVTGMLTCGAYWFAPGIRAKAFVVHAISPKPADALRGSVSRVIATGEIFWISDHSQESLQRSRLAHEAGLRGAVFVPIRRSIKTTDVLEFFSERTEAPDQVLRETLDAIGREVGQFLDRRAALQFSSDLERERGHLLELLELQLEHMPVACVMQDSQFRVVYCNPAAERIFGYSVDELRGQDIATLIVPAVALPAVTGRRARLRCDERNISVTMENFRKDQSGVICEWNYMPLYGEGGEFNGVLATAQDVTERMQMVEALEESEERYRQIFAATPLPMWVADAYEPRFLAVNEAAVRKYGYSRSEFEKMTALDLQAEGSRNSVAQQLRTRDPSLPMHFIREHVTKSGERVIAEITAQPFHYGGQQARLIVANDVTDSVRAQQALENSEARFRAIFEQASVGIAIRELGEHPRFLRVNRKLCEILGYSEDELLTLTTTGLTAAEDAESTQQINLRLLSGELRHYSRRKRYRRKDDRIIWVNLSVSRLDEGVQGGKVGYLLSVIEDITDQVESEARMIESEARYRQIFALAPLPMYLRDEITLQFIDVNKACHEMYGYTRDEMLNMSLIDIQTPAGRERYRRTPFARPMGAVERLQKQHARRNGELIDVEIHSYPTMLAGRKVRLVLIRDMTEQLNMERLLRDNESRLRAIADNVPAVIAFFDGDGSLQYSNFAYDRWFVEPGSTEQVSHSCSEVIAPLLGRALEGHEVTTERVLETQAGQRVARLTLIPHRKDEGGVEGAYLMGYDLTDFRRAEEEVRHLNAELEQRVEQRTRALAAANRELESFSYSVSHDLRAPLRTIDGFSQILIDEYAEVLDESGKSYLERVRAGSQRMAKLIDDLLELARVTRRDLQIRNCNLSAMAHDIFSELSTSSPERSFKVKVAPGMKVKADEGLLRIALDNLLRNAWKFTGLESEALIEVGCIDSEGDVRTFFVRDNGVGFDMAYVDKLFGAFQRLHSETEFQGTGIGLALVQRVIRRHGGQVWAEAEPQCGATFYFSMPAEVLITDLTAHLKAGT